MKYMKILCLVMIVVVLLAGCKGKAQSVQTQPTESQPEASSETVPEPTRPELTVTEISEEGDRVVVTTSFVTFSYPFAFSDLLGVTVEENRLVFVANQEQPVPVYTIRFDDKGMIALGSLYLPQTKETLSVTAELMPLPEGMADNQNSFFAIQETFNDVIASLEENAQFTPAEA